MHGSCSKSMLVNGGSERSCEISKDTSGWIVDSIIMEREVDEQTITGICVNRSDVVSQASGDLEDMLVRQSHRCIDISHNTGLGLSTLYLRRLHDLKKTDGTNNNWAGLMTFSGRNGLLSCFITTMKAAAQAQTRCGLGPLKRPGPNRAQTTLFKSQ